MMPRNSAMVSTSASACSVTLVETSAKAKAVAATTAGAIAANRLMAASGVEDAGGATALRL